MTLYSPSAAATAEAQRRGIELLRWRDVATMVERAGAAVAGPTWRVTPLDAPREVSRRLLLEWAAFSNHELKETVVERLTPDRVAILAEADRALDTLAHLLAAGFTGACDSRGAEGVKEVDEEMHAGTPSSTWLAERGCKLYARCDTDVSWATEEPAFVVGAWAEGGEQDGVRGDADLLDDLAQRGFRFFDEPGKHGWFEIALILPLSDIAAIPTFQAQERHVLEFCARTIDELVAARPS